MEEEVGRIIFGGHYIQNKYMARDKQKRAKHKDNLQKKDGSCLQVLITRVELDRFDSIRKIIWSTSSGLLIWARKWIPGAWILRSGRIFSLGAQMCSPTCMIPQKHLLPNHLQAGFILKPVRLKSLFFLRLIIGSFFCWDRTFYLGEQGRITEKLIKSYSSV